MVMVCSRQGLDAGPPPKLDQPVLWKVTFKHQLGEKKVRPEHTHNSVWCVSVCQKFR